MKNYVLLLVFLISLIGTNICGIYRHDRNIDAYRRISQNKAFECVGHLIYEREKEITYKGTCVLVSKRHALTARHLFFDDLMKDTVLSYSDHTITTYIKIGETKREDTLFAVLIGNKKYKVKYVSFYNVQDDKIEREADLAVLELNQDILDIKPAKMNGVKNELGEIVTIVGYGHNGPANRPDLISSKGEKLAGKNTIDSIGGVRINGEPSMMYCDMDSPEDNIYHCNVMGSSQPLNLEYTVTGGDSGGGIFRRTNKGVELIGISPEIYLKQSMFMLCGYYGQVAGWRRISVFKHWINKTVGKKIKR